MDTLRAALTVIWAIGFALTLWAGATDRFRLEPYGLPRTKSGLFRRSAVDAFYTLFWFVYVPAWFVYRRVLKAQNKL